jgi:ABC-type multidrug transport system fused ATPase/permease subunit
MRTFNKRNRFLIAPIFLAALAGIGLITMLLWNNLLPQIFHLPQISYWQAVGLLILSRLLFGFSSHLDGLHNHRMGRIRERWEHMNQQEREEFIKHLHHRKPFESNSKENIINQETSDMNKS